MNWVRGMQFFFLTVIVNSMIFTPFASMARTYTEEELQVVPQSYQTYFQTNDPKMDALEIIYMNNSCATNSSTLCRQISSSINIYAGQKIFPTLANIPGALDTLRNDSTYNPPVGRNVVNNIRNEITDADIALQQYRAQLNAANKCRGTSECDSEYRKATEELAKAQNRKTNAQKLLDEYRISGILPSESEGVGNGTAHASDVGEAKAEDYITMTRSRAASDTAGSASSTFAAAGTGSVTHTGLDADSMNVTTSGGFAGQLVMQAIGSVGRALVLCSNALMQAEVMAFVAGAAIYMMTEITAYSTFKNIQNELKASLELLKRDKGAQREAFYKMLGTYENMKAAAQKKQQGQKAAAAAFFAAAAIAAGKYGILIAGRASCVASCSAATATWSACCGPHAATCCRNAALCSSATGVASGRTGFLSGNDLAAIISSSKFASTLAAETSAKAGISVCGLCSAGCSASFMTEKMSWVACPPVPSIAKNSRFEEWNQYFLNVQSKTRFNLKASVAQADKVLTSKKVGAFSTKVAAKCGVPTTSVEEDFQDLSKKILNYFIPQANALEVGALLGVGGVAASMLSGLILTEWSVFDMWIHGPLGRSIVFSLAAAFAVMEASHTGQIIAKIETRIALVKSIIARMEAEEVAKMLASLPHAGTGSPTTIGNVPYLTPTLGVPERLPVRIPCMVKDNNSGAKTQTGCGSILVHFNSASDQSLTFGSPDSSSGSPDSKMTKIGLSDTDTRKMNLGVLSDKPLNQLLQSAATLADSIQGSDSAVLSEGSMAVVDSLASKLSFAESSLKLAEKDINKKYKAGDAGNKKLVNFDSLKAAAEASLQRAALTEAKKQNMTLEEAASQFGLQLPSHGDSSDSSKLAMGLGQNDFSKGDANSITIVPSTKLFDFKDQASANNVAATSEGNEENLKTTTNLKSSDASVHSEIIDRPETSIFQIISVRYIKSGLSRLGFGKAVKKETSAGEKAGSK